jgi:hypothetical protein
VTYDLTKDPFSGPRPSEALGLKGAAITTSDDTDFARYTRVRAFAPTSLASATVRILPAQNADGDTIDLSIPVGAPVILEYIVRRVATTGTTAGVELHSVD